LWVVEVVRWWYGRKAERGERNGERKYSRVLALSSPFASCACIFIVCFCRSGVLHSAGKLHGTLLCLDRFGIRPAAVSTHQQWKYGTMVKDHDAMNRVGNQAS
jgi:hypothetical protein